MLRDKLEAATATIVRDELKACLGNVATAADELGVSRGTMYRLIRLHGIDPRKYRPAPGYVKKGGQR